MVDSRRYYRQQTTNRKTDLFRMLPLSIDADRPLLLPIIGSADTFQQQVIQTRDYIAHRPAKIGPHVVEGEQLYWLGERVDFLMKLIWLRELGLDETQRATVTARQFRYHHLKSLT